jgi:predicted lipid-binding transport protein (Tim44 family)
MTTFKPTSRAAVALLSVALILAASVAEARGGRGMSFGSRGGRTFAPPPVTQTAPRPAQGIERSMTQPGQPGAAARNPGVGQSAPRAGGFFNRPGFVGGLFTGLLGAGLLGMLFGGGFFGGLSGLGSMLGLVLQLALAFFLIRWAMRAFARRSEPAMAGGPALRDAPTAAGSSPLRHFDIPAAGASRSAPPIMPGMSGLGSGANAGGAGTGANPDELGIAQADLDAFERLLVEIQTAYGQEDVAALRRLTTPEMLSYFLEELTDNSSRGVVNRVSDVKLLSGDVAESWREGEAEYATAAMQYSLHDVTVERDSDRVVETGPSEATELWTFRRAQGGNWILSAIQQA